MQSTSHPKTPPQANNHAGTEDRRTWQEFEDAVEGVVRSFHPFGDVIRNAKIMGCETERMRQLDIAVKYDLGGVELVIVVECKRERRAISAERMGALVHKFKDVKANLGIVVSEHGFTKGALNLAEKRNIKTYSLRDTRAENWVGDISATFGLEIALITLSQMTLTQPDGSRIQPDADPAKNKIMVTTHDSPEEEPIDDYVRRIWIREGEGDGVFNLNIPAYPVNADSDPTATYRLQLKFSVATRRLIRNASFDFLGLMDCSDGKTLSKTVKILADVDSEPIGYSKVDFEKHLRSGFCMIMKTSIVSLPALADTEHERRQNAFFNHLTGMNIELEWTGGKNPITVPIK